MQNAATRRKNKGLFAGVHNGRLSVTLTPFGPKGPKGTHISPYQCHYLASDFVKLSDLTADYFHSKFGNSNTGYFIAQSLHFTSHCPKRFSSIKKKKRLCASLVMVYFFCRHCLYGDRRKNCLDSFPREGTSFHTLPKPNIFCYSY